MSCNEVRKRLVEQQRTPPNLLYISTKDISDRDNTWLVAMTVAYRGEPTIRRTLESLRLAGWDKVFIWAEPDANDVPLDDPERIIRADENLGAWANFSRLMKDVELITGYDKFLYVQDDVEFLPDTLNWLEQNWPVNEGISSLYRSSYYAHTAESLENKRPWEILQHGAPLMGALALAMSRDLAISIAMNVDKMATVNTKQIDIKLSRFCHTAQIPINICTVSRCQHTGHVSSIYDGVPSTVDNKRKANTYGQEMPGRVV